jgi:hypothetical protein
MALASDAAIVTVPAGLNPGDTYRLVFVTTDTTTATSTNIADYNAFVTSEADSVSALADLGATWTVIGSTDSVDALTNIGASTSGIYNLVGQEVADGTDGLFTGTFSNPANPIDIDQHGATVVEGSVWTGTNTDGTAAVGSALGDSDAIDGYTTVLNFIDAGDYSTCCTHSLSVYAISSELTVGSATPEPTSVALSVLGGTFLLMLRKQKRK